MPDQEGIKTLKLSHDPWSFDDAMKQAEEATIEFLSELDGASRAGFIEKVSRGAGEAAMQTEQGERRWRPVNL